MSDHSDLIAELRALADCDSRAGEPLGKCMRRAADKIERLAEHVDYIEAQWLAKDAALSSQSLSLSEAREALKPFAKIAAEYADQEDDDFQVWRDFDVLGATLPLRIFRRARKALENGPAGLADATNAPASSDLSSLRKGAEELRRKLAGYAITEEYDFPSDAPEFCGFWCNECKEHVEADGSGHRDSCLCHGVRPQTARAALVSGSREDGADD